MFVYWLIGQLIGPSPKRWTIHTEHLLAYIALTIIEGFSHPQLPISIGVFLDTSLRLYETCPFVGWLVGWSRKHPTPKI